ncbi:MAG: Na+/H+ antiporter NhaA [Phenylobacterium sp.]|nr:Na+/H+ antiporter NhaA [Phenylobacterium sp.]
MAGFYPARPFVQNARMSQDLPGHRLDRPVGPDDHRLGDDRAPITLVEYGSYACPHCRTANERIAEVRGRLGERLRYVFRQRPLTDNALARRAADVVERARTPEEFWRAHMLLMARSDVLTEDDVAVVARELAQGAGSADEADDDARRAQARVDRDIASAAASGVQYTPTFFINGRRYEGPWDENSLAEAMMGSLAHRLQAATLDFVRWAPSTGVLLLIATIAALAIVNSPLGPAFQAFWHQPLGLAFGGTAAMLPLQEWVDSGLLSIFFLVVGLEIKREFTVGRLATRRTAALPVAAAVGGMIMPAVIYVLLIPTGAFAPGWGIPIATDTAFAVALIVILGDRVPIELRVFLTAAVITDDLVAIGVVAVFYSGGIDPAYVAGAVVGTGLLVGLHRAGVSAALPYAVLGVALWICLHNGGLHATLAGVILAVVTPTRPPPNLKALIAQAETVIQAEIARAGETVLRNGPSEPAMRALDTIHERIESPADKLLRAIEPWSSYVVLPLFAFANAGVVLSAGVVASHGPLVVAIVLALVLGKPLGILAGASIAVRLGLAVKPDAYSWRQLAGAGALAGIGFTMSLFIAGQAFPDQADFAAAKIAVFLASILAGTAGTLILWRRRTTSA